MYFPITKCPYCGNDEVSVKCRISGECNYNIKLDGSQDAYNGGMCDYAILKPKSKYAYCNNCGKRLFKHGYITF